ncbi:MAG: ASKHA domain-containing protein, partial [Planctomycetota bacterium]
MPIVILQPAGVSVQVEAGTSLLEAARKADVPIRSDCGGQGVCGRCRVEVRRGDVTRLGPRRRGAQQHDLACRTIVAEAEVEVFLPEESREVETEVSVRKVTPFPTDYPPPGGLVERAALEAAPPSLDDNVADGERLVRHLRKWRDGEYHIPLNVLRDLPRRLRDANWQPEVALSVEPWGYRVLHVGPAAGGACCLMAVDVGTTAIKARLLAPESGWVASCYNSQRMFGPDVISRIMHCQQDESVGCCELKELVVADINRLLDALLEASGLAREDVWGLVVSGNTTMMHLFLGLHPVWIRRDPYVGCAYRLPPVRPKDVGVNINQAGRVFCLPSVSSFVGADITAGILAAGLSEREKPCALIDLGTNGEIVIGCREFLVCCSASAGPAFEGAGSASGTRAREGAIDSVWDDGGLRWQTIGDAPPVGICGTGYIDLLATLLRQKVMDKTGRFAVGAQGVEEYDGELQYVLVPAEQAVGDHDIVLTRADVENLVRAKGAIYAGGSVLLQSLGMGWADLETIMLAGGFGESVDKDNAVTIGLLPDVPRERIEFAGNTSLQGAIMAAERAENYWKAR